MTNSIYTYGQPPGSGSGGTTGDTIKLGGQPIALGAGNVTAGTQRITIATNDAAIATLAAYLAHIDTVLDTMEISMDTVDNWNQNNRCKGSPVVGQDGVAANTGVITANTQRFTIATNDGIVTSLSNLDAWNDADRCKINMYLNDGVMVDIGTGLIDFGTQRVTIGTDDLVVTYLAALVSASGGPTTTQFFDGVIDRSWAGTTAGADTISNSTPCPWVENFNYGYNGATWDRLRTGEGLLGTGVLRVNLATDDDAVTSLGIMDDWDDGANNCNVNINAQTLTAIKISKDANANATGNRIFVASNVDQLAGSAINVGSGVAGATGTQRIILATDDPAVTSLAILDNFIGTNGAAVPAGQAVAQVGGSDGTFLRTLKTGADGAAYVNQNNLLPGEDAVNDERAVKVKTLGTGNGSALAQAINTVGGGTIGDPILTSTEVLGYSRICLEFKNAAGGGGNDIDRLILFGSVSGSNWDPIYDSGAGLAWSAADGGLTVLIESNGYRYIKTEGLTAAGDTTVDCSWCGNKG